MVFSGHTVTLMLCFMTWRTYGKGTEIKTRVVCRRFIISMWFIKYYRLLFIYVYVFMSMLCIIGTKFHYSLDVFLAFYLTWTVWNQYHDFAHTSFYNKGITSWLMKWLEAEEINALDAHAYELATALHQAYSDDIFRREGMVPRTLSENSHADSSTPLRAGSGAGAGGRERERVTERRGSRSRSRTDSATEADKVKTN